MGRYWFKTAVLTWDITIASVSSGKRQWEVHDLQSDYGIAAGKAFELAGAILYRDTDLLSARASSLNSIRGKEIALIMQNPMTAFNLFLRLAIR